MPDLSIIIPVKDTKPQYLEDAVRSIASQRASAFNANIIIVDDDSTSKVTLQALSELHKNSQIFVLSNNHTSGVSGARNTGIKASSSQWIGFIDSDDWWSDNALCYFSRVLEENPSAHFIAGDSVVHHKDTCVYWNRNNSRAGPFARMLTEAHRNDTILQLHPLKAVELILRYSILVSPGSLIVKKDALETVGGFNEGLTRGEDVHLWLRLARLYPLFFIPRIVFHYRKHDGATTWGTPAGVGQQEFLPSFLNDKEWKSWHPAIRYRLSKSHNNSAWWFRGKGRWFESIYHSAMAIKYSPSVLRYWKRFIGSIILR